MEPVTSQCSAPKNNGSHLLTLANVSFRCAARVELRRGAQPNYHVNCCAERLRKLLFVPICCNYHQRALCVDLRRRNDFHILSAALLYYICTQSMSEMSCSCLQRARGNHTHTYIYIQHKARERERARACTLLRELNLELVYIWESRWGVIPP
jgi:hypothetical protein